MFCNICNSKNDKPLCLPCEALVRRRVRQLDDALPVLWRTIDDGSLRNHQRDVELLERCDERLS